MEQTGTWALAERPVSTLSGGERQRVLIARAWPRSRSFDPGRAITALTSPISGDLGLLQHLNSQRKVAALAAIHDLNLAVIF